MGHVDVSHAWGELFKHTNKQTARLLIHFVFFKELLQSFSLSRCTIFFKDLVVGGGTVTSHSEKVVGLVACVSVMVVSLS